MTQWLLALAPAVLKVLLDFLLRLYDRRTPAPTADKPARRRRRRRIA